MTTAGPLPIVVIGEALLDLVETDDDAPRLARPGGSPYNVAIGLARLGQPTAFAGRLSADPIGDLLRKHAQRSGVDLTLSVEVPEPSTVALVELDGVGNAQYHFGGGATADFGWTERELARIPDGVPAVHFGSLAAWTQPGDAAIARTVTRLRAAGAAISYDPNVRPALQPDPAAARAQIERSVPLAHLVKASEEDLRWLRPGESVESVAQLWLSLGPSAVVITRGGAGATAFTTSGAVTRPPIAVDVVDTVGAGDAFMSGLLDALARRGLLSPAGIADASFAEVLDDAGLVAALTCSRAGANPPRRADLVGWHTPR